MKKLWIFVFISFFLFPLLKKSIAQNNFIKGNVFFQNGDTLSGFIDYRNWAKTPEKISFKEDMAQKPNRFYPEDILGFYVNNERYISANVTIETSNSHKIRLDEDSTFHLKEVTVFLQVLIDGPKSLYYLNDHNDKEHFYIFNEEKIELLKFKRFLSHTMAKGLQDDFWVKETRILKTQEHVFLLMNYLKDCAKIEEKIQTLEYSRKEMEAIFLEYYSCINRKPFYHIKAEGVIISPGFVIGLSSSTVDFKSNLFPLLANTKFPRSMNLCAGVSAEFILPRNHRKWSLYNELFYMDFLIEGSYLDFKSDNNYDNVSFSLGQSFVKLNNSIKYSHPTLGASIFIHCGISNGFLVNEVNLKRTESHFFSTDTITEEKLIENTQNHETELFTGIGGKYGKGSLEIRYEIGNGPSNIGSFRAPVNRLYFLFGYQF